MTAKHGIIRDHRCKGAHIAHKCEIFETVDLPLHGYHYSVYIHMSVQFQDIGINKEKQM